ncbi:bromodomain-containing protein DDB_G0280777 [Drosophila montana]|uniref:bromodomain-containing protein DDB_G0280777 n=1 Tax=Drosophila montana TaxID=40370 RepID=UPI00313BDC09
MERRCIVCGQTPTSGFTYPHNMDEAVNWQNMLACFVPVETLLHHCCVCHKHVNRSEQVQQRQKQKETRVDDLIEQRRSVTFNKADAVLYFGQQSKKAPHSCTQFVSAKNSNELQTKNNRLRISEAAQLLNNPQAKYRCNYIDTATFNGHPGSQTKVNNMAATNPLSRENREEDTLDNQWATRRTSGNETYASQVAIQCQCGSSSETIDLRNARQQNFETKRPMRKAPTATRSNSPPCICGSSCPIAMTAERPMNQQHPQRMTYPSRTGTPQVCKSFCAVQSFNSALKNDSGFPINISSKLEAFQQHKQQHKQQQQIQQQIQQQLQMQQQQRPQQQQQRQRAQQNQQCQSSLASRVRDQMMQCPSQKFNQVPAAQEDECICCPPDCIDNTSPRADGKAKPAPVSSAIPKPQMAPYKPQQNRKNMTDIPRSPPVSVLIMGGSNLPTYCNTTSFRAQPSHSSEICVLESDFTREGAVFPDIDEPNYTVCRAPAEPTNGENGLSDKNSTEVLLLGIAQPEKNPCFERTENNGLPAKLAQPEVPQKSDASAISKEQSTRLDELEQLLTQQRQLQQTIQAKLNELQGKTAPATPRMSAGNATKPRRAPPIRTGPNPTQRILSTMSSYKTK